MQYSSDPSARPRRHAGRPARAPGLGAARLLVIGCGDVGLRMLPMLRGRGRVLALTSTPERVGALREAGALPLLGDLDRLDSLRRLRGLATRIAYLAPPPGEGDDDPRMRRLLAVLSRPFALRAARARGTGRAPARILPELPGGQRLSYVSTSGVYGDCAGARIDETRPVRPQNARAVRRVAAERRLRAWGGRLRRVVTIVRAPGIYAAERLPLARLRQGTPALRADEDVYTNHIHADDLARVVIAALDRGLPQRVYHASDDSELQMGAYFDMVADWAGLDRPPRIGAQEARTRIAAPMLSFMRESRRLDNARLRTELGLVLRYPTVAAFLAGSMPPAPTPSL